MDEGARKIRTQIARLRRGKPRTAVRYPATFQREVLAIARHRRARGVGVPRIARELGLAPWTLALWLRKTPHSVLRVVNVTPDSPVAVSGPPLASPVLITPQGIRIEGADVPALATLLRALQ